MGLMFALASLRSMPTTSTNLTGAP